RFSRPSSNGGAVPRRPAATSSAEGREEGTGRVCVRTRRHGVARGTAEGALVRCVAVRLYEKRREAAAAWLQPLIVAEEESASEWSRQLVERAGDVILFQESSVTGR